ncbi:hypothetical protein [Acrocarpospora sp. B8E8]|uniref:hypothetical protein n=1 Tax=Acrocarpospora sp. B8E8 TaxID=3153572 RepID=UPI00325DAFC5
MSRYKIPNAPDSPDGRVTTVGWDAPLSTFFAMAFDPPASGEEFDDEIEVFWVGGMPGEIPAVVALESALSVHGVTLPADVRAALGADRAREGDRSQVHPSARLIEAMRSGDVR